MHVDFVEYVLVVDGTEKLEARSKFLLGPVSLNDGADNCDVDVLRANIVRGRHACNVDICGYPSEQSSHPTCVHVPFRLPTWFCGMMICALSASSVPGIGCLRKQMARTTLPSSTTRTLPPSADLPAPK